MHDDMNAVRMLGQGNGSFMANRNNPIRHQPYLLADVRLQSFV
jgi:hypothetical protein